MMFLSIMSVILISFDHLNPVTITVIKWIYFSCRIEVCPTRFAKTFESKYGQGNAKQ